MYRRCGRVPRAIARMNARKLTDCDLSPSEIMLGWQTRIVAAVLQESSSGQSRLGPPVVEAGTAVTEMRKSLTDRREWIRQVAERRHARDDPRRSGDFYDVGEWVWEFLKPERDFPIGSVRRREPPDAVGDASRMAKLKPRHFPPPRIKSLCLITRMHFQIFHGELFNTA